MRYDFRSMPSRGMSGLSWNGCQRTEAGRPSRAFSSRRLPMKHHGQITSEITSMVSIRPPRHAQGVSGLIFCITRPPNGQRRPPTPPPARSHSVLERLIQSSNRVGPRRGFAPGAIPRLVHHRPGVKGLRVRDHRPLIPARGHESPDELGDGHRLGAGQLDGGVQRCADGDVRQGGRHVVGRQRLHGGRREPNGVAFGPRVGDPAEELEELRGPDDRVRHPAGLDQLLLVDLGPHVPAVRHAVRPDHRQRDVVPDPGRRLGGQQVAGGRVEELHHRRVRPGRRVRHVHDHVRARERLGEPLAGEGVDARGGGGRNRLVALLAEDGHELLADEPAAADHDDLHVRLLDGPRPAGPLGRVVGHGGLTRSATPACGGGTRTPASPWRSTPLAASSRSTPRPRPRPPGPPRPSSGAGAGHRPPGRTPAARPTPGTGRRQRRGTPRAGRSSASAVARAASSMWTHDHTPPPSPTTGISPRRTWSADAPSGWYQVPGP